MTRILHLTHTDIHTDSRILKSMNVMADTGSELFGLGVKLDDRVPSSCTACKLKIESIRLSSKNWRCLPRVLRHTANMLELTWKMVFRSVRYKPDTIHCNDVVVLPLGVIVKLFTKSKLIYDAHELESDRNGLSPILKKLTFWTEKLLWRFIDGLIVVSPSIDTWYQQNIGSKQSEIILNSPLLNDTPLTGTDYFRKCFDIPQDKKVFLYLGYLMRGRGLDLIVDAFRDQSVNSCVVFMGCGELTEQLKEISDSADNIFLHDPVSHEDVVSVASSADVGLCLIQNVSLSDYFCLPNKLFEYVFAGVPVLASGFPDIKNAVDKYNLGLCCDLTKADIIKKVNKYENADFDVSFDRESLHDLSWQRQSEKLCDFYKVINGSDK